ncbi:MAG: hypothetical protein KAS39_07170, partial [Actinomycetia bacterium]|nr:hypothetical protein [Actinomycetes bacterium]
MTGPSSGEIIDRIFRVYKHKIALFFLLCFSFYLLSGIISVFYEKSDFTQLEQNVKDDYSNTQTEDKKKDMAVELVLFPLLRIIIFNT